MKVKSHSFFGRRYRITQWQLDGFVEHPETNSDTWRQLNVDPDLRDLPELEAWVHESTHAAFPRMSEQQVAQAGRDISRLLWRLGYRKM